MDPAWAVRALDVPRELRAIMEAELSGSERSQQRTIGPSQLGTTCLRCLVHGLAETPQVPAAPSWYAGVGTAMHEWAECAVARHEYARLARGEPERWMTERRVAIGYITHPLRPRDLLMIGGTSDVYDRHSRAIVDYKGAGTTALREMRAGRVKPIYAHQVHLYGLGVEAAGDPVESVIILGLPRNAATLAEAQAVVMPYDRDDALATLARADQWARLMVALGVEAALQAAGPHTGEEFSCGRYADAPAAATPTPEAFLALG